jgi:hypothetical protein
MTQSDDSKREAARLRKRRQRELAREAARLAAEHLAARREIVEESLAPAVRRNPVMHPDGKNMLVGVRVVIQNGKPMRADPIANLARKSPLFNERHKLAARKFAQDVSDVGSGITAVAVDLQGAGGGCGDGTGGHDAILEQIQALRRLQGGLAAMGDLARGVVRVAIDCLPVSVWAVEVGLEHKAALLQVVAGLTRLANFYSPQREHPIHGNLRSVYYASRAVSGAVLASGSVRPEHVIGQAS